MTTFVTVSDYPVFHKFGINLPTCGLRRVSLVNDIIIKKCFKNKYQTIETLETEITFQQIDTSNVAKRIFNGSDAKPSEAPWVVNLHLFLKRDNMGEILNAYCTGVLIALDWILTAAHCMGIRDLKTFKIKVNAGSNQRKGRQISIATKETWFIHPSYSNSNRERDVALIKLNNSFNLLDNRDDKYLINTICLPKPGQTNLQEDIAFSYGFGIIKPDELPEYLQKMDVILRPFRVCEEFFCANRTGNQSRTCFGDSGGPLLQFLSNYPNRAVLIGIVHGGGHPTHKTPVLCGTGPKLNRWIAVPNIIDWILNTIRFN